MTGMDGRPTSLYRSGRAREGEAPEASLRAGEPSPHAGGVSFDEDYRSGYRLLFEYFFRRLHDTFAAEDLAAMTLDRAWLRGRDGGEQQAALGAARQVLSNYLRRLRQDDRLALRLRSQPAASAPDPATLVDERYEELEELPAMLGRLNPVARQSLRLVYVDQLSPAEAAEALGCSRRTFAVRLYRARAALRQQLERAEADTPGPDPGAGPPKVTSAP